MTDAEVEDQIPAPSWSTCMSGRSVAGEPCRGRQVDGFDRCLAHLEPEQLDQFLRLLAPGADLDASGTEINAELLKRILRAVTSEDAPPLFGRVDFQRAYFRGYAGFRGARFSRNANFSYAQFGGYAGFVAIQPEWAGVGLRARIWLIFDGPARRVGLIAVRMC